MKKVRSRYAPSPTGYLHIGGARTALFAYIYAKHFGGDFIVRIEDTDQARNVADGEKSQLENLEWLGIVPDESPIKPNSKYGKYRQSEKLDRYQELIEQLLNKGDAYKAYDSSEELEKQRIEQENSGQYSFRYDPQWLDISEDEIKKRDQGKEYSIRIALKKNTIYKWKDIVRGNIEVNTKDIGDFVIMKQDGFPTYNFGVVVDDHDMEISHVLRGEEHITNTPKQMAIYDALGWEYPEFGHLTIITNMEGKKLSKRDTSVKQFIEDYKNDGYHSYALFNFLTMLGWSHKDASEVMTKEKIISDFDPARFSKSPSKFDERKMNWYSKEYIKVMDNNELIKKANIVNDDPEWLNLFLDTYKMSAVTFKDIETSFKIYDKPEATKKAEVSDVIMFFKKELLSNEFTIENIQAAIKNTQEGTGAKGKNLFMPIRLATTYEEHGPELAKAIFLFGEKRIKERMESCT